ncbi:MAG: AAA family ATPase [Catenulispora sp.]|nr:AAA family ATPase [Catenulispora sp.]
MRVHYPRTAHLPWSPGATADDVRSGDLSGLVGRQVVITEKMDGENTTLYRDGLHARSLDSAHHPSRTWIKALHGRIADRIPDGWRICGENLFARHSIPYADLDGYFYGFSVWDGDRCLDWDATVRFLRGVGIPTPRVLFRGVFDGDERTLGKAFRLDLSRQEGYVVRAADGFAYAEFGARVAKWVRPSHVQTHTHWMFAEVVPNGLGSRAPLWAVRSGMDVGATELATALGLDGDVPKPDETLADAYARLDVAGCFGSPRLIGAAAALLNERRRADAIAELVVPLGLPMARRVGDVVGNARRLHNALDDEQRRAGLVRMAFGTDLAVLHAVSAATAPHAAAREHVAWSVLIAEEAGLLPESPLPDFQAACREAFAGLPERAANRCWGEARELFAQGRVTSAEEAVAATWRWRDGDYPQLTHMAGISGSGKSTLVETLAKTADTEVISLDEIRTARGSRTDQSANQEVLHEGIRRTESLLARGVSVVWDATSLMRSARTLVDRVAARRNALIEHRVLIVPADDLAWRNVKREHPVPEDVLAKQIRRYEPSYPGEAHRVWYHYSGDGSPAEGQASDGDVLADAPWED